MPRAEAAITTMSHLGTPGPHRGNDSVRLRQSSRAPNVEHGTPLSWVVGGVSHDS
jgi:hypothetical protein